MTGRLRDDDPEGEAKRREEQHRLRMWAAHGPSGGPEDPIHVIACRVPEYPAGVRMYALARWSLIARLVADAEGQDGHAEDLGPDAMILCQAANRGSFAMGEMVIVGFAKGNRWTRWMIPTAPREPVPRSPGQAGQRN